MDQLVVQVVAALLQQMPEYSGCGFATDDAALLLLDIPGISETRGPVGFGRGSGLFVANHQ
jgi:hypothetical protein